MNEIKKNMPSSEVFNSDCLEGMKNYPDNFFDLAIVDPPYGDAFKKQRYKSGGGDLVDGLTDTKVSRTGGTWASKFGKKL